MADDFDVEALLEAPFKKEVNGEVIYFRMLHIIIAVCLQRCFVFHIIDYRSICYLDNNLEYFAV